MSEVHIEVRDLAVGWRGIPLMENLDFDVYRGQIFIILGGSGSGKTTLFRNMIGLEDPIRGTVRVAGYGDVRLRDCAPHSGVLFQSSALFGSMTLAQNVAVPLQKWTDLDRDAIETIVNAKLRLVGLECFENHLPSQISGGMKKRAGIARALALDPDLLFLDEPSAGLDPITAAELDDLILTLKNSLGVTLVIVTHELASIFKIADHCILLHKDEKGIIAQGPPDVLSEQTEDERVRNFFHRIASK